MVKSKVKQTQKCNSIRALSLTSFIVGLVGLFIEIVGIILFVMDPQSGITKTIHWILVTCFAFGAIFTILNIVYGILCIKKPLIWKFNGKKLGITFISIFSFVILATILEAIFNFVLKFSWAEMVGYILGGIGSLIVLATIILNMIIYIELKKNKK